jgi:hypothetical protein
MSARSNVAPAGEPDDQGVTGYALAGWDRTARLCAIRLAQAVASGLPVMIWLLLRR